VRAGIVVLLVGLAIAVLVFVATSGGVVFLPLIFLPCLFFWPRRSDRDDRL
jgi:hypothetical protein